MSSQTITLTGSGPEQSVNLGDDGGTLQVLTGGATVYYRARSGVSTTNADGSLAAGSTSGVLYGTQYLIVAQVAGQVPPPRADVVVAKPEYQRAWRLGNGEIPEVQLPSQVRNTGSLFKGQIVISDRNAGSYGNTADTSHTVHLNRYVQTCTCTSFDIRALYGNYTVFAANANDIVVEAWLEVGPATAFGVQWSTSVDDGKVYQFTFNGAASATIKGGVASRHVSTDPLPVRLTRGSQFAIWTRVTVGAAEAIPLNNLHALQGYGDAIATDATASGTTPDGTFFGAISSSAQYTPVAVLGTPDVSVTVPPTFAIIGDSIPSGTLDNRADPLTPWPGFIERALGAAGYGYVNNSVGGKKFSDLSVQGSIPATQVMGVCAGVSHVICEMGRNDVSAGTTLATMKANALTVWSYMAAGGAAVWQTTTTHRSDSSDLWATVANQSDNASAHDEIRVPWNAWLRDGAPILNGVGVATGSSAAGTIRAGNPSHPLKGYIEIADVLETARDSGRWKAAKGVGTGDVTNASASITNVVVSAGTLAQYENIIGTGVPSGRYILARGASTITLNANATATNTGVTLVSAYTDDGLHPNHVGHIEMTAAVTAALPTIVNS